MKKNHYLCFLLVLTTPVRAQNSVPAATATATVRRVQSPTPVIPPPVTASNSLAALLTRAEPPRSGVALTVDAERIPTLSDAPPLRTHPPLNVLADATGRLLKRFGGVTALAPPTMVVLNPNPTDPNPFDGMPPSDALALLAATLSPAQWAALTSERGLGASDLTTSDQRNLFSALFPADQKFLLLKIGTGNVASNVDVSSQIGTARLRLTQKTGIMLQIPVVQRAGIGTGYNGGMSIGGAGGGLAYGSVSVKDDKTHYELDVFPRDQKNTLYGVNIRGEVPNAAKRGDLNFDAPTLQVAIPTANVKTVGELITRIGTATRLEFYADARMETKSVTIIGSAPTATAADLLRALAFCLMGTYRQVGPAYVLTDDLLGYGTRLQRLQNFQGKADSLRLKAVEEARDKLVRAKARETVRDLGANLTPTPEQSAKNLRPEPDFGPQTHVTLHRADLNAAQREAVTQMEAELTRVKADPPPMPNGDVVLSSEARLEILLPDINQPIAFGGQMRLFQPSAKLVNEQWQAQMKSDAEKRAQTPPVKKTPSPPPIIWTAALQMTPRRAVLASPASVEDAKKLLAAMQKLGFNQLWMTVSVDGKDDAILTATLQAAKAARITVLPVLDILLWPKPAPTNAPDLTILGEASAARATPGFGVYVNSSGDEVAPLPPPPTVWVSPSEPTVADTLRERIRALAALPGVTAFVWNALQPPGYEPPPSNFSRSDALGYTLPARLAFLRQSHTDPIDLEDEIYFPVPVNLPNLFGGRQSDNQWRAARYDSLVKTLRGLREKTKLPVITKAGGSGFENWFGTWDSAARPLPIYRGWSGEGMPQPFDVQARAQSKITLARLEIWDNMQMQGMPEYIAALVKSGKWDGIVIDLTPNGHTKPLEKNGVPMLTKLAESVTGRPSKP